MHQWCDHQMQKRIHIRKLERIQRVATNMVLELRELTYEDRLKEIGLTTLQCRRERGDLITLYEIVNGMEKLDTPNLVIMEEETRQMRGHSRKIKKSRCLKDTKSTVFHIELWILGMV